MGRSGIRPYRTRPLWQSGCLSSSLWTSPPDLSKTFCDFRPRPFGVDLTRGTALTLVTANVKRMSPVGMQYRRGERFQSPAQPQRPWASQRPGDASDTCTSAVRTDPSRSHPRPLRCRQRARETRSFARSSSSPGRGPGRGCRVRPQSPPEICRPCSACRRSPLRH